MQTIQFRDYLELDGVKESIERVKVVRKAYRKSPKLNKVGIQVEETIANIISESPELTVKPLTVQMDVGFGADIQVSYKEGGKNYSFFVDITTREKGKDNGRFVQYLSINGATTNNPEEAFNYQTEYFNVCFGLKERHNCWFRYEKPVIILYITEFTPCTGLAISHINNIANILKSLNGMLVDKGYGARASQKVRPNPKKFKGVQI